jgi:hypothetical protein
MSSATSSSHDSATGCGDSQHTRSGDIPELWPKRAAPILAALKVSSPLLLMDVDGVLNPYPDCPAGYSEFAIFPEDEEPVRLCAIHGDWLRELGEHFTLI